MIPNITQGTAFTDTFNLINNDDERVAFDDYTTASVKYYDGLGTLIFTLTSASVPALTEEAEAEGTFYQILDIPTGMFNRGWMRREVEGEVDSTPLVENNTIIYFLDVPAAFGNLYCTVQQVRDELPTVDTVGSIDDALITSWINQNSRFIDDRCYRLYAANIPFPDIEDLEEATPGTVNQITIALTVDRAIRHALWSDKQKDTTFGTQAMKMLNAIAPERGKGATAHLMDSAQPITRPVRNIGFPRNN